MKFDKDTLEFFSSILRYNVSTYVDLYSIFVSDYQKRIEDYYKSITNSPDVDAFDFLESMIMESNKIDDLIKINKKSFSNISHWELIIFLDDIKGNLITVQNSSKWLGSNKSKNSWRSLSIQSNHILQENQTLEEISQELYKGDSQNDWVNISLRNNLMEKDYTIYGGNNLELTKDISSNPKLFVKSVIDSLIGERVYGLDLNRKITFKNGDLDVKSFIDTVKQSVLILSGIKKKDVPEFPFFGVDADLGVGGNIGHLAYKSVVIQLEAVFATDDTLTDFNILDVEYDNADLSIKYQVDTFYNKSIQETTKL